jgi:hypothetical protein
MFERFFFLGLPQFCDPKILFKILSYPHFAGNAPPLHIKRTILHPEWNNYFYISLQAGNGLAACTGSAGAEIGSVSGEIAG